MIPIVRGNRICYNCKGLCHKDAWREKTGKRKKYWCSEKCVKTNPYVPPSVGNYGDSMHYFERVDVITR